MPFAEGNGGAGAGEVYVNVLESGVFLRRVVGVLGFLSVYLTLPTSDYSFLKLPRTIKDLRILRDHLERYTSDYTKQVLVGYFTVYIFMPTFLIPGTGFLSLLTGSLFGVFKGLALVVFAATAGASSCYFLSKLIGRPIVFSLWPDKLNFFQSQVATRQGGLLNYMLFLRAGIALGELRSVGDLYDFQSIATMFLIGLISVTLQLMGNNENEKEKL